MNVLGYGFNWEKKRKTRASKFQVWLEEKKTHVTTTFQVSLEGKKNNIWVFNLIEIKRKIKTVRF